MQKNLPSCNKFFVLDGLIKDRRIDGRALEEYRDLHVNFGQSFGSCYVQMGNTIVFATSEAVVDEPSLGRPCEGRFRLSMNVACGGKERWLRHLERAQPPESSLTTRAIEKIMNRLNVIDLESLCLVAGKHVWCISTKVVVLNYDGNLMEVTSIATMASLMHFRLPASTVLPDGDIVVHSFEEKPPIPLTLFHYPISVTFQSMDETELQFILPQNELIPEVEEIKIRKAGRKLLCDPTEEEESFFKNVLILTVNTYREIVAIKSLGRIFCSNFVNKLLEECSTIAFDRVQFVVNYLKEQLDKHKNSLQLQQVHENSNFFKALENRELCMTWKYMQKLEATKNFDQLGILEMLENHDEDYEEPMIITNQTIERDFTQSLMLDDEVVYVRKTESTPKPKTDKWKKVETSKNIPQTENPSAGLTSNQKKKLAKKRALVRKEKEMKFAENFNVTASDDDDEEVMTVDSEFKK